MEIKSRALLRILFNHFEGGVTQSHLQCLPPEERNEILNQEVTSDEILTILSPPQELIKKIHYSWLLPIFQELPKEHHSLFLSALPQAHALNLCKMMNIEPTLESPSPPVLKFLSHLIFLRLGIRERLPLPFLPRSSLMPLFEFHKKELVELVTFLGLYDLAEEIRRIVDKQSLKMLYHSLSSKQQKYMKVCLHQKDKLSVPRLELENCKGNPQELHALLHRRGLIRLGKALCGQHPDFVWHLTRFFDTGRGSVLMRCFSPEAISGVTAILVQQVLDLISFLRGPNKT